jgi:hypothetical protein
LTSFIATQSCRGALPRFVGKGWTVCGLFKRESRTSRPHPQRSARDVVLQLVGRIGPAAEVCNQRIGAALCVFAKSNTNDRTFCISQRRYVNKTEISVSEAKPIVCRRTIGGWHRLIVQTQVDAELGAVVHDVVEKHLPVCEKAGAFEYRLALER